MSLALPFRVNCVNGQSARRRILIVLWILSMTFFTLLLSLGNDYLFDLASRTQDKGLIGSSRRQNTRLKYLIPDDLDPESIDERTKALIEDRRCVVAKLQTHSFIACVYSPEKDIYVSSTIISSGYWERDIGSVLKIILSRLGKRSTVFLNIGANLGIHALNMASQGFKTWAVEPQLSNLLLMVESARLSDILQNMVFVQNGVDEVRRTATMHVDPRNNGGSYVKAKDSGGAATGDEIQMELRTVLLSDLVEEIRLKEQPKYLVLLMDMELYECNALMGSQRVLRTPPPPGHPAVAAVIMEWSYNKQDKSPCPAAKQANLIKVFTSNGYLPFTLIRYESQSKQVIEMGPLSTEKSGSDWDGNVIWFRKDLLAPITYLNV